MSSPDNSLSSSKALHPPATSSDDDFVRLHITPFNSSLLKTYLGPSLLSLARNTSFHTLQNFPEKPFGYVEVPKLEAEKMRKKLNGTILKGQKVKIEEAKPNKSKRKASEAEEETPAKSSTPSKRTKTKTEQGVLPGVEVEEGRRVKRGWTEPSDQTSKKKHKKGKDEKKDPPPSKYTDDPEMLFRTKLPPGSTDDVVSEAANKKAKSEKKAEKQGKTVLHEFENRKILRFRPTDSENNRNAYEYTDGKGWVDRKGDVVEAEKKPTAGDSITKESEQQNQTMANHPEHLARNLRKAEKRKKREERNARKAAERAERNDEPENDEPPTTPDPPSVQDSQNWTASASALEALYKRRGVSNISTPFSLPSSTKTSPTKPPPINTKAGFGFGFVDGNSNDDDNEVSDHVPPLTPFSREDRESRGIRSAAPTPDTAAIGRTFSFSFMDDEHNDSDDDDDDSNDDEGRAKVRDSEMELDAHDPDDNDDGRGSRATDNVRPNRIDHVDKEESEFSKWFWENRGDNNREWKRRRREALKGKRQRENRRIGKRTV